MCRTAALLIPVAIAGLSVCAATPAAAIANGEAVGTGLYSFSVKLTMTGIPDGDGGRRESSCSGALIAPRWVITAGHCFRDSKGVRVSHPVAARTTATVGRTKLNSTAGRVAEVVAVHQSPTTDVALAELDTAITGIPPLRVATTPPAVGDLVRLTGYGLSNDDESQPVTRLQTGQFAVESVGDSLIAMTGRAPKTNTSPCLHDSGGPYFTKQPDGDLALVAVVSGGPACPHIGADQSGRVDNIAGWISGITQDAPGSKLRVVALSAALLVLCSGTVILALARRRRRRRATYLTNGVHAHRRGTHDDRQPVSARG
jgi:secreted trypsin-like serine protease